MPTNRQAAMRHLRETEWNMGNGQCWTCCGSKPGVGWWTETVGHKRSCGHAKTIRALGGRVDWEKPNKEQAREKFVEFWRKALA